MLNARATQDHFFFPLLSLGKDALPNGTKLQFPDLQVQGSSPWDVGENEDSIDGQIEENRVPSPSFPELELKVKEPTEALGRSAIPKFNCTASKDAAWISQNGTLKCSSFSELVLLLNSFNNLVHVLCHAVDSCEDKLDDRPPKFYLAYANIRSGMEFRRAYYYCILTQVLEVVGMSCCEEWMMR